MSLQIHRTQESRIMNLTKRISPFVYERQLEERKVKTSSNFDQAPEDSFDEYIGESYASEEDDDDDASNMN